MYSAVVCTVHMHIDGEAMDGQRDLTLYSSIF